MELLIQLFLTALLEISEAAIASSLDIDITEIIACLASDSSEGRPVEESAVTQSLQKVIIE